MMKYVDIIVRYLIEFVVTLVVITLLDYVFEGKFELWKNTAAAAVFLVVATVIDILSTKYNWDTWTGLFSKFKKK
ncbi:MAG: hypothetical protein HUJ98_06100 [Bacteroidaceae bacterium]|nr:hypothetical protein [Bacteroidaceae bacterium]